MDRCRDPHWRRAGAAQCRDVHQSTGQNYRQLAEVDLETKAKALANCEVKGKKNGRPWKEDTGLMEFLRTL
jgi:hypothetical protein